MTVTFGSLFAGIGGFDLGFERAGMECKWQVEIEPYCQKVLAKHWPNVRRHDDVRTFPTEHIDQWRVDVICGGFPCQDISYAGRGAGLAGERSGLFFEAVRVVSELRPRIVVLENVAALLTRGLDAVLGTLAEIGFDAEWDVLSALEFGAPHIRERIFIVATDPATVQWEAIFGIESHRNNGRTESMADANIPRLEIRQGEPSYARTKLPTVKRASWWATEPEVGRVANGVPARVDRLRGLGNAVVPQVAEWIGRRIMEAAESPGGET